MYVPSHCTYSSYLSYNAYFVYFIYDIDVVHWLQRDLVMDSKSTTGMLQIDICGTEQGSAGHCVSSSVQQQPGSHFHLLHPPDWAYKTSGSNASIIMAVFAEEIAADQSPGHDIYLPAGNLRWRVSAQDGQHLVLQAAAPV